MDYHGAAAQADYSHEFFDAERDDYYFDDADGVGGGGVRNRSSLVGNLTGALFAADSSVAGGSGEGAAAGGDATSLAEVVFLFALAAVGMSLNVVVVATVALCTRLRRLTNAFIVHGALVDAARCALCLPYALGALGGGGGAPVADCDTLGTVEVVALSVSMFNLLGMALTEAFTFHVHNVDEFDTDRRGAVLCVAFGVFMVYAAGLIIHLGPTLIGGHFQYARGIGSCSFRDYVLQAIWVAIVTLTVALIFAYIVKFYRQLKANDDFRIRVLGRAMAAAYVNRGSANSRHHSWTAAEVAAVEEAAATAARGGGENGGAFDVVRALQRRIKVLATIAASYVVCYYPYFALTLLDRQAEQPKVVYKILTYVSWSQAAIAPLVFIACDDSLGLVCSIRRCCAGASAGRRFRSGSGRRSPKAMREDSRQPLTALTRDSSYAVSFADKLAQRTNGAGVSGGSAINTVANPFARHGGGCGGEVSETTGGTDRAQRCAQAWGRLPPPPPTRRLPPPNGAAATTLAWPPPPPALNDIPRAMASEGEHDRDGGGGDATGDDGSATPPWIARRSPTGLTAIAIATRFCDSDETAI